VAVPDSICPVPWQNLSLDVDGSSRPCCKFAHFDPGSPYQLANLADAPLDEVWNGSGMQKLRQDFLDGVRPAECSTCWDEEDAGVPSLRQTWFSRGLRSRPDYETVTPEQPVAFDLKLSNACNLKCRICGPVASSLWLREEAEVQGDDLDPWLAEHRAWFRSDKITRHDHNAGVFAGWMSELEHLELTGGEPMMSPENRRVVDLVVREGVPEQVALLVTTNATVIDERIAGHFDRFGQVMVSLSIDDIGPRLEYERGPADWPSVEANILRYAAMASETCRMYVNCSISTLNVWYLPEFVAWLSGDPRLAPIRLNLNLVHNDRHFNIRCLPPAVKVAVRARLAPLADDPAVPAEVRPQVLEVLDFMDAADESGIHWDDFVRVTEERDRIRAERFDAVFPELHAVLVDAGAWPDGVAVTVAPSGTQGRRRRDRLVAMVRGRGEGDG
jgi:radical SAM protein with 4Fe4S-binding SPASM domain